MERANRNGGKRHFAPLLAGAAALALAFPKGASASPTWDGSTGDWFDATHWSPALVPQNSGAGPVILTGNVTLNNTITTGGFTLGSPAFLEVSSNNSYSVASVSGVVNSSGQIDLGVSAFFNTSVNSVFTNATVSGAGFFQQLSGIMQINGSASFSNLVLGASSSVAGSGTMTITHELDATGLGISSSSTVKIAAGAVWNETISTASPVSVSMRLLNSGTVSVSIGTLTLAGSAGGSVTGGSFVAAAGAAVNFNPAPNGQMYTLDNATLAGTGTYGGSVTLAHASTVTNASFGLIAGAGSLDVLNTLAFVGSLPTINSGAQVRVLLGGGLTFPNAFLTINGGSLTNQGNAALGSNTVTLQNGGAFINQGVITIPQSGSLNVTAQGGGSLLGTFSNAGTINTAGPVTITAMGISTGFFSTTGSGSFQFPLTAAGTATLDGATLKGVGYTGTVLLKDTTAAESVSFATMIGAGAIIISQSWFVPSSTQAVIKAGAHVTILPSGNISVPQGGSSVSLLIDNAMLTNAGPFDAGTAFNSTTINLAHGGVIENQGSWIKSNSSGTLTIGSDGSAGNQMINSGTIDLPFSSAIAPPFFNSGNASFGETATFTGPVYNTGAMTSMSSNVFPPFSVINIAGGGSGSGLFSGIPASSLMGESGNINFSTPYTLNNATLNGASNTAALTIIGNIATINGGISIEADIIGSGTIIGTSSWGSGSIMNTGGVKVYSATPAPIFFLSTGHIAFASGDFIIYRGVTNVMKTLDGTTITVPNVNTAVWSPFGLNPITTDQITFRNGGQIINNGTFYTFVSSVSFNNGDNHTRNQFINTGVFGRASQTLSNSNNITTFQVPFHNSGLVDIQQGFIDFAGGYFDDDGVPGNAGDFQFAPGAGLAFLGGDYSFGGAPFDLGKGGLKGTGTIHTPIITSGTVAPGNSPGTLVIDGDLTLEPGAVLNFEIAGDALSSPAASYDLLIATGNLAVDGTLSLTLLNSFVPGPSDTFLILQGGSMSGVLANLPNGGRIEDNASTGTFLASYSATGLMLSDFQAVPEPMSLTVFSAASVALLLRRRGGRRA